MRGIFVFFDFFGIGGYVIFFFGFRFMWSKVWVKFLVRAWGFVLRFLYCVYFCITVIGGVRGGVGEVDGGF